MTSSTGLSDASLSLIRTVLERHPGVSGAILFGSRAKGTASPASDVDLVLQGIADPLEAERVRSELEELPLPFRFDVKALTTIQNPELLDHIARVGIRIHGIGAEP